MKYTHLNFKSIATRLLGLLIFTIISHGIIHAQNIYQENFDDWDTGPYNSSKIKSNLGVTFCKGADEGRVHVTSVAGHSKVLEVRYPKGEVKTSNSGMHTKIPLNGNYNGLYMSYWVYFPDNFEFRAGAKLPGLAHQSNDKNMSLRLMWRHDGLVEYYVHYNTTPTHENYRASINWSLTDVINEPQNDQIKFKKGEWNHVELYNKLNTPGQKNGIMRGWLNGEMAINITDNGDYRTSSESDIQLNTIYWSTFFGGSNESYQPTKDLKAYFDNIQVSTTRIGYPGYKGDNNDGTDDEDNSDNGNDEDSDENNDLSSNIVLEYQCGETGPLSNSIKPYIKIYNNGSTAIDYSDLKVRYFFTPENTAPLEFSCSYATLGKTNITGNFINSSGALDYLEVSINDNLGSLAAHSNTGTIKLRINYSNWGDHNQSNDFSYDPSITSYTEFSKIVVYLNGTAVWGEAPSSSSRINLNNVSQNSLTVYPNPSVSGKFTLNDETEWSIYSLKGTMVTKGAGKDIDISGMPSGIYFLKAGEIQKKLIIK